jgi:aldehyde:ferredoxin oxidoreductase
VKPAEPKFWNAVTGENISFADGMEIGREIFTLDRAKVEEWKTKFYAFEGFNTSNGWPKRETLEKLGLKKVVDALQSKAKLG